MQRNIILPDLGQTTGEAKIVQWLKKPGDRITRGEPIVAVATDKVDMEVEAFEGGYIRELLVKEGSMASAMAPLAILTDLPDEDYRHTIGADEKPTNPTRLINAAPAARALAKELRVDLTRAAGTGPNGLITRADVQRAADTHPATSASVRTRALAAMAATTTASKRDIPHFYAKRDLEVAPAARWRERWNSARNNSHASFTDVFVRCAALALADVPRMNVAYADGAFEVRTAADLLLVAAREAALLLLPVNDPCGLTWEEFLRRMHDGDQQRQSSKSTALLAISNLGMYGMTEFSAIIPPGCSSALAIGAVREAAVVRNGVIAVERIATVTLSADHRVIDGIAAARFLQRMQFHLNSL